MYLKAPFAAAPASFLFFPFPSNAEVCFVDWKKILLAALSYAVIGQAVYFAGAIADMPYYTNPAYSAVWSPIMMPGPAPPPAQFYILSIGSSIVMGAIFAYGYMLVGKAIRGGKSFKAEKPWQTGAKYGLLVFALAGLSNLTLPLLINIPFSLALSWTVQSAAVCLLAGAVAGRING